MTPRFVLIASTLSTVAAGSALADPLTFANDSGGTVNFYGQFSPAYVSFDDGEKETGNLVDNTNSNTRVGFTLDQPIGSGATLGFVFETALGLPASSAFSQNVDPIWEWDKTKLRKIDVTVSGAFGKVSLGQGSMASDGIATVDLSRTDIAGYVYRPDLAGAYFLRDKATGDLSDVKISDIYTDFDGSRRARIRYDTPSFSGFSFAAAYGKEVLTDGDDAEYYDIGLFYERTTGSVQMQGALGYAWKDNEGALTEVYAGSFSLLHEPTGIVGVLAAGADQDGGSYGYVKAGWTGTVWNVGYTAVSVDYYGGQDLLSDGSTSDSWGVQAVQKFDAANLEAYLAYSSYSFDETSANYQDANSTTLGIRWKF
ncbi:porin-like protein [Aliiruegeria haliotis]|uniref:Porin-like protein n=1 Tax=Aliiruegeria haliotis TaxID=1280846 RepID=A0A2T0RZN0_9RHOB|nr:porin [Aliiruegeria haliotis]PRY26634.1 porin-like protein [Aliiruegeria haliotis]